MCWTKVLNHLKISIKFNEEPILSEIMLVALVSTFLFVATVEPCLVAFCPFHGIKIKYFENNSVAKYMVLFLFVSIFISRHSHCLINKQTRKQLNYRNIAAFWTFDPISTAFCLMKGLSLIYEHSQTTISTINSRFFTRVPNYGMILPQNIVKIYSLYRMDINIVSSSLILINSIIIAFV